MRPFLECIDSQIPRRDPAGWRRIVLILHDQLNLAAWEPELDASGQTLYLFIESKEKGQEIAHHKKKAVFILSSMRTFALELHRKGLPVLYWSTREHFDDALQSILDESAADILFMEPSEWDTRERLQGLADQEPDRVHMLRNRFFLADPDEWVDSIRPGYRMEFFYREMRRRTGYLMRPGEGGVAVPEGGEWNYDDQNRKSLPAGVTVPPALRFPPSEVTEEVMEMVEAWFPEGMGSTESFSHAVSRSEALEAMEEFIERRLAQFGDYEDAMRFGDPVLFHSRLSLYLNNGLLLPGEVCEAAIEQYRRGRAPLNSVEGFVRQILGWREYIRVYYEAMMPAVRDANHFGFTKGLPSLFWTGETKMTCLRECVGSVLEHAWGHHIPRLMVLSNFSNLTQTDPRELSDWFLLAYADAYEWVELPNVLGMSTFADGGVLASKPYVAGGNYINKMSDYCSRCAYSVKEKTGEKACPFNYLYWNFVDSQRETFNTSGRVNFMVQMFEKKAEEEKQAIREDSERFIRELERLQPGWSGKKV